MPLSNPAEMAVYVRAVESGGFSPAARALALTPSAVSKIVTRLEDRLGVRLLNRTTRSLSLTPEGEQYFTRAQRILAEIEQAEGEVTRARLAPRGLLRMHTSVAFGLHQLPPVLPEFVARYPEIELMLTVTDRLADLVDEGIDVAVRLGKLPDSTLVTRRITDVERVICAAPSYLAKHGTPKTPDDLRRHNCLRLFTQPALSVWPFNDPQARGRPRMVEVEGRLSANNADTLLQMAVGGLGIARLADLTVGAALQSGALVPVLTDYHFIEPVPLQALMPPGRHRLPKVTAMVDFLIEHFAGAPWRATLPDKGDKAGKAAKAARR